VPTLPHIFVPTRSQQGNVVLQKRADAIIIQTMDTTYRRIPKPLYRKLSKRQTLSTTLARALNLTFSFAAFGIKYGAVDQSFAPPYFMKVNGMPYWRMLLGQATAQGDKQRRK
jgi:hypothetical protein